MQVFQLYIQVVVLSINKYLYNCRFYAIKFCKIQQCSIGKSDQRACLLYADRDACARHFPIQRSAAIYYFHCLELQHCTAGQICRCVKTVEGKIAADDDVYTILKIFIIQVQYYSHQAASIFLFCILLLYLIFTRALKLV